MSRISAPKSPAPEPVEASAEAQTLYDSDLYAWSLEQARLIRERRFDEVDADNVAEEFLNVAKSEYRVLESALRVLLTHMLKWDHQPARRTRSWANTIAIQRRHAERQLRDNPSLKPRIDETVEAAYGDARLQASSETDMDVSVFPEACPYGWDDTMGRPFERAG